MHELKLDKINKLLIIRFSSLGDVLLTSPLLRSLKNKYHKLQIDFLVREEYADALLHNKNINRIFKLARGNDNRELLDELKGISYDLIVDLQNNLRSRNITRNLTGKIVRFKKPSWKKFLLVKFKINLLKEGIPIPRMYANTLDNFQLDDKGLDLFLPLDLNTRLEDKKKYVGFCPGSRHYTKQWPQEYFIELGNLLTGRGFNIVLFGGKDDLGICEIICEHIPGAINLCNDNDLLKTASEMKKCSIIICNDSGLMHISTAVRVPVISIFGSTVREFGFAPYQSKNLILENNLLSCRPCSHIGRSKCPKKHFKCMKDLTAQKVFDQFNNYYNSL